MKHATGITTLSIAAALIYSASFAPAQSSSSPGSSGQSSADQSSSVTEQSSSAQPWKAAQKQEFFRASDLIGKSAQDKQAQKIGSIKDVVFNQQGEIFALVDVGSSRWAAVPMQLVEMRSAKGDKSLVLNTSKQAVSSSPVVTKDQWGALNNPSFTQGIYSYYKIQNPTQPSSMGGASDVGSSMQGQGSSEEAQEGAQKSSPGQPSDTDQLKDQETSKEQPQEHQVK